MKICFLLSLVMFSNLSLASGENGRTVIIHDLSQQMSYDLSGQNGADGANGSEGHSGRCYSDNDSVRGDDGGNGQNGEDGGNGGNAIVHFSNIRDLQNLKIISFGRDGGRGGKGGSSGFGCGGAQSGSDGKPGNDGSKGRMGSLYLIKHPLAYIENQTAKTVKLEELMKNETIMVENIWDKATGAANLLARSSQIADEYYLLNKVFKKKIVIKWLADSDATRYSKVETNLNLAKEKLKIDFSGYVADQSILVLDDQIEISIYNLVKEDEIIKLDSPRFSGIGTDIKLEFSDSSLQMEGVKRRYEVNVLKMGIIDATYIATTNNANDFISVQGHKVEMALGKLDFEPKYKKKGTRLLINFKVYAEVNGQQKTKSFVAAYKVGKPGSSFERSRTDF